MRIPRTQGRPPHWMGFTVMRSMRHNTWSWGYWQAASVPVLVPAVFLLRLHFFHRRLVFEELQRVLEQDVLLQLLDQSVAAGVREQLLRLHALLGGHSANRLADLFLAHVELFPFGDLTEDEADLHILARLLGGGADDLVLHFHDLVL